MDRIYSIGFKAMQELNARHKEVFGVEPVITGIYTHRVPDTTAQDILEAINSGKPYVEPPVPDGVVI